MKKILFLIALPMLLLASCTTNPEVETNNTHVSVRTIGNHQYLFYHEYYSQGYAGGVCHYEDCQYCKTLKEI